ncbi:MAG: cytochrome b [Sphingomicrobium sp.]
MSDYMVEESSGPMAVRYRGLVIAIHWLSAALIITQIWLGFTFNDFPKGSPERTLYFDWHKTVGVVILLLAIVRLGMRLMNPPPPYPQDFPRWERAIAVWTHRLFYFLIIALPLTGLAAVSKGGSMIKLVGGLQFPTVPIPALGGVHEALAWAMIVLLGIHILAAMKNQFITGGVVAGRMPPFRQAP